MATTSISMTGNQEVALQKMDTGRPLTGDSFPPGCCATWRESATLMYNINAINLTNQTLFYQMVAEILAGTTERESLGRSCRH